MTSMLKIALSMTLVAACGIAQAQSYPNKPVRMVVGCPPGGGTDIVERLICVHLCSSVAKTSSDFSMNSSTDLFHAQLFLDDAGIDECFHVSRHWHQPERIANPVLVAEHPWERWAPTMYGTVLHWRGKFRMWYLAYTKPAKNRVCYAESDEGVA